MKQIRYMIHKMGYRVRHSILRFGIKHRFVIALYSTLFEKIGVGKYIGVFNYCNENNDVIAVLKDEPHTGRAPSDNEYQLENVDKFQEVTSYKVYVSVIRDVCIYGCSDIIRKGDYLLNDRIEYDSKNLGKYKPTWIEITIKDESVYYIYKNTFHIEKGIYLVKMWSENWTHFLVETISRLQFIDRFPEYDQYPILLDAHLFKDKRNEEVVNLFNKRKHPIIKVEKGIMYEVEELIYPAQFSWFLYDKEKSEHGIGWAIDSEYLKNVRSVFWSAFGREFLDPNRKKYNYYLARGDNNRLVNEDEVSRYLSDNGFIILDTSKMTLKEEVECFMNANAIVCMMGSGLANMIFCETDTTVFEFCPLKLQHDSFAMIADPLEITNYYRVNAKIVSEGEQINETRISVSREQLDRIVSIVDNDISKTTN